MRKISATCFLAAWVTLLIATCAWASDAQTWNPLDRAVVIEQARGITPERYPDSDVVGVDSQTWIRYRENGTYTEWFEAYVKVFTEKGKRRYRTLASSFSKPYNTTKFTLVEVIRPDGSAYQVDIAKNSREMVESSQMDANIYNPDDKVLQVGIPELEAGDVVHYIMTDEIIKARMAGTFNDFVTFEDTDPIRKSTYTVVAPRSKPLKSIVLKAEIKGTVTHTKVSTSREIVYQWVARDVPRAFEEPEMPPLYTQAQRLLVSTIPDWRTVSRWYWNLSKPHLARTTPEMRSTVERLVKGIRDRDKKVEAIFRWASQKVRYLGIVAEKEAPGYEPHPVSMTFERRAGVCRDKAALLVAMLRLAGFEAYPVLIMVGPKKDPEVPQPFFNHAVACVKNTDGSYQLMDPTNEDTREMFPAYLNNQSFVVATPGGETLLTSPVIPADRNMMRIETAGALDARGVLRAETSFVFEGINDNAFRGYFSTISSEEQRNYFEKTLRKVIPGATLEGFDITPENMLDTAERLKVKIRFSAPDYPVRSQSSAMLPVFRFGDSIGVVNHLTQRMGLTQRRFTYRTEITAGVDEKLSIDLDPSLGTAANLPFQEAADDEASSWSRSVLVSEGRLLATNRFTMKLPEYLPAQYKRVQDTLTRVEKANRIMPAFSGTPGTADAGGEPWYAAYRPEAVVLDARLDVDIIDESSWTETLHKKVKVLNYAGKKRYGDMQIPFNPVWEEISVQKVLVTSPSGQEKEIAANEINVMDEKWVGEAPRYPAAKIMVISMPGLQEGSTIEYTLVRKKKDRQCFSLQAEFQGEDPIEASAVRIRVPDGIRLNLSKADGGFGLPDTWKPFPAGIITEERKKDKGGSVTEFKALRVPPVRKEDDLPPGYSFVPSVRAAGEKGRSYAAEVDRALRKASSDQANAVRKAQEIIRSIPEGQARLLRIRDFVAQSIHGVEIGLSELPLSRISPADRTLADGYGNEADRAVLLFAMCEAAGYRPEFLLTVTAPKIPGLQQRLEDFPAPEVFDKVLVRVKTDTGSVLLGDTDQYAALGSTFASGSMAVVAATGAVETLSAAGEIYEDRVEESITIDLGPQGDATIRIHRSRYGMDSARFRKDYQEMTPEEQKRRFQEIVSSVSRAAVPLGPYTVTADAYPVIEDFTVSVPGYAVRQKDRLTLDLPGIMRALSGVTGDERFNPLLRDTFVRRSEKVEVVLPAGVRSIEAMPPESLRFDVAGAGEITSRTTVVPPNENKEQPGRMRLVVEQRVDLKPLLVLPEGYDSLLEIHRAISHPRMRTVAVRMVE